MASFNSENLIAWMAAQHHPVTLEEICGHFGCSVQELENESRAGSVSRKEIAGVGEVFFLASLVQTTKRAKTQHLSSSSGPALAKRPKVVENRNLVLSELKRKKLMIDKHTSSKSKETVELEELIVKWQEAGMMALEDLARRTNGSSLAALCKTIGVDGKLLGVEQDEEEEEEEKEEEKEEEEEED